MDDRRPAVHVLHVDDDPDVLLLVGMHLRHQDAVDVLSHTTATDCATARSLLGGPDRFDVVLLDHHLPDGTGLELLADVARDQPAARTIVLTTREDRALIRATQAHGARAHLPKSELTGPRLAETIVAALDGRSPAGTGC